MRRALCVTCRTNDPVLHERNRVRQKHALKLQTRFVKWHEPRAMSCTEDQRSRLAVVDQVCVAHTRRNQVQVFIACLFGP